MPVVEALVSGLADGSLGSPLLAQEVARRTVSRTIQALTVRALTEVCVVEVEAGTFGVEVVEVQNG